MTTFDIHILFMELEIFILQLLCNQRHCMADWTCVELVRANFVLTAIPVFTSHTLSRHPFVQAVTSQNRSSSTRHTTPFK
jgi:thymidylate synthase ThyX